MQIFRRNYECKYLGSILCNLVIPLFAPFNLIPCSFNLSVMDLNQLVKPGTISLYLIIISTGREKSPSSARMRERVNYTHTQEIQWIMILILKWKWILTIRYVDSWSICSCSCPVASGSVQLILSNYSAWLSGLACRAAIRIQGGAMTIEFGSLALLA